MDDDEAYFAQFVEQNDESFEAAAESMLSSPRRLIDDYFGAVAADHVDALSDRYAPTTQRLYQAEEQTASSNEI